MLNTGLMVIRRIGFVWSSVLRPLDAAASAVVDHVLQIMPSAFLQWGLAPFTAEQRLDMLELLDDRYGQRSTLVTSQMPVDN
jgi:hypothetical protein